MREESSLAELSPGGYGLVAGLAVGGAMGCRLRDLGFLPGASVEALGKSPPGGSHRLPGSGDCDRPAPEGRSLGAGTALGRAPHLREGA